MIDLTYSDLSEDEIAEYLARQALERADEKRRERERWAKAREFRFIGGMA